MWNYKIVGLRYVWGEDYQNIGDSVDFFVIAPRQLEQLTELLEAYGSLEEDWANPLPIMEVAYTRPGMLGTWYTGVLVSLRTATGKVWEQYPWIYNIQPETKAKWFLEGCQFAIRSTKIDVSVPDNYAYPCHGEGRYDMMWCHPGAI